MIVKSIETEGFVGTLNLSGERYVIRIEPRPGFSGASTEYRKTEKAALALFDRRAAEAKATLGKLVAKIVDQVRAGSVLCTAHRTSERGVREVEYFMEPGGKSCPEGAARRAIATGLLRPSGDSLLGPDLSQTWTVA